MCVPFPLSLSLSLSPSLPISIPPGRTTQEAPLVLLLRLSRLRRLVRTVSTCAPLQSPPGPSNIIIWGLNPFDAAPSSLKSEQIKKRETEPLVSSSPTPRKEGLLVPCSFFRSLLATAAHARAQSSAKAGCTCAHFSHRLP